jgi:2-polyprenyl-3-methyl-5-hydroxy-6-metoxy-1,4-benzoquinol methylase
MRRGVLTSIINTGRKIYNWFFRRYLRKFISRETRLLEVGCGTATLTLSLADEIKELVGVDISEAAIELSDKNAKKLEVVNAKFELGDCLNLNYENEFDVVWSQGLMEHFDEPGKVAFEHYKATSPGGVTLISVPYKYSYHALWYGVTRPKLLRPLWPWTEQVFLSKKELLAIGRTLTDKAHVHFLQPFPLGIIILELPK